MWLEVSRYIIKIIIIWRHRLKTWITDLFPSHLRFVWKSGHVCLHKVLFCSEHSYLKLGVRSGCLYELRDKPGTLEPKTDWLIHCPEEGWRTSQKDWMPFSPKSLSPAVAPYFGLSLSSEPCIYEYIHCFIFTKQCSMNVFQEQIAHLPRLTLKCAYFNVSKWYYHTTFTSRYLNIDAIQQMAWVRSSSAEINSQWKWK